VEKNGQLDRGIYQTTAEEGKCSEERKLLFVGGVHQRKRTMIVSKTFEGEHVNVTRNWTWKINPGKTIHSNNHHH